MGKSIADIKKELSFLDEKDLLQFAEEYKSDERSGEYPATRNRTP